MATPRDRFLHQVDVLLVGGPQTLAAASTPVGLTVRQPLKTLQNEVFHKASDNILVDPFASNG